MPQGSGTGNLLLLLLPLLLILWLFWTQRRRAKAMSDFQSALTVGAEVVTTAGMFGRIVDLDEVAATLEVAPGVRVRFDRRAIAMTAPAGGGRPVVPGEEAK